MTVHNQPHGPTAEQAYHRQQVVPIHQALPLDVMKVIINFVADKEAAIVATQYCIRLGRVNKYFCSILPEVLAAFGRTISLGERWYPLGPTATDRDSVMVRVHPDGRSLEYRTERHGARM